MLYSYSSSEPEKPLFAAYGQCLHFDCSLRSSNGYCSVTACMNRKYNGTGIVISGSKGADRKDQGGDHKQKNTGECGCGWELSGKNTKKKGKAMEIKYLETALTILWFRDVCSEDLKTMALNFIKEKDNVPEEKMLAYEKKLCKLIDLFTRMKPEDTEDEKLQAETEQQGEEAEVEISHDTYLALIDLRQFVPNKALIELCNIDYEQASYIVFKGYRGYIDKCIYLYFSSFFQKYKRELEKEGFRGLMYALCRWKPDEDTFDVFAKYNILQHMAHAVNSSAKEEMRERHRSLAESKGEEVEEGKPELIMVDEFASRTNIIKNRKYFNSLPPTLRKAVYLRYYGNEEGDPTAPTSPMSIEQVADALGIAPSEARSMIDRAMNATEKGGRIWRKWDRPKQAQRTTGGPTDELS